MDMETFSKKTLPLNCVSSALAGAATFLLIVVLAGCVHRTRIGPPEVSAALACSVSPSEVLAGEPVMATVSASNFSPNHPLTYEWTSTGPQVSGRDNTATIDTAGLTAGSYAITVRVTDSEAKQRSTATCSAQFSVKQPAPLSIPTVSVSANPTNVGLGEGTVFVTAVCDSPDNVPVTVNWAASSGRIMGTGHTVVLDTSGVPPGPITIRAVCSDSRGLNASGSTEVSVEAPPPPPPPTALPIVDTGRAFLLPGDAEKAGYGMYSYLLWWNMPVPDDRNRFLNIISAFMLMPKISMEEGSEKVVNSAGQLTEPASTIPKQQLNVAYIPVTSNPTGTPTAEWILDHYDIARARALLSKLPRRYQSGPYIVSSLVRLSGGLPPEGHYLFQNLSSRAVSADLADAWVRQFQEQVQTQEFWQPNEIRTFVLSLRANIAAVAPDVVQAKQGLATWISWLSPPQGHQH
jgi:hypothetical protein